MIENICLILGVISFVWLLFFRFYFSRVVTEAIKINSAKIYIILCKIARDYDIKFDAESTKEFKRCNDYLESINKKYKNAARYGKR